MTTAVETTKEKPLEFIPFGSQEAIKLTVQIVQKLLAVPTKSGRTCSDRDAIKFMMLCKAKGLNPFEGDAYLIGYDTQVNGAIVPTYSLITAHQAFLKRAELHPEYDGMKSGLILLDDEEKGLTRDTEGDFHLSGDNVIGGWATVFFKTRKNPMHKRLRMARFNKGFGVWKDDAAGMIVKCAEADALRSSFPTKMGGMFLAHEFDLPKGSVTVMPSHEIPAAALVDVISSPESPTESQSAPTEAEQPANGRQATAADELAQVVTSEGFTFQHFIRWGTGSGNVPDPDSIADFSQVPADVAKRLLRAKAGLLKGLAVAKAEMEGK